MAQVQGEEIYLSHSGQEVDDNIEEVVAARGSEASLSARLAAIVSGFEADQQRQDAEISTVSDAQQQDRATLIDQVDKNAKNVVNLNTSFTTHTNKGITYTNNGDGTINVSGTSNAADSYVTLYDVNGDTFFGIPKGKTVVLKSTSNNISINLIYKKQGGGYGLTVRGYMDTPAMFTIPDDFAGYLLRIGVYVSGTTVDDNVGAMICTAADYVISSTYVQYAPTNRELYEMILALQSGRSVQSSATSLMQAGRLDHAELTAAEPAAADTGEEADA